MITIPSSGDNYLEYEDINHSIISIMDFLENISDTYTEICVKRARATKDYDDYRNYLKLRNSMFHTEDKDYISSSAGHTICSYKAFVVSFLYLYLTQHHIPHWIFFRRRKQYLKDISEYANNFSLLLDFKNIHPETFSEEVPDNSCIGYMLEYVNGKVCVFGHAFIMIAEGDYFIIYDAWGGIRTKWLRAMEKSQVKEILSDLNLLSYESQEIEKFDLFKYFFRINIPSEEYFKCNGVFHFHYIELESEKFKEVFDKSKVGIMFGGKKSRVRKRANFITFTRKKL
jgi:hypothetical protein